MDAPLVAWHRLRKSGELFDHPALVIGHRSDPLHPCSDADRLAEEMPNTRMLEAKSICEWRVRPSRLNRELVNFLDEVWARPKANLEAV